MLSIGIVGLPNVGKSTLFNALTQKTVPAENYPFCTIDPAVGVVAVPDARLEKLANFSRSAKTIPAAIEFVDIAGLVKGAAEGQGLGNQFLSHIREVDAIAHVLRIFEDPDVTHVEGSIDPVRDMQVIEMELALADLQTVEKRLQTLEKDIKRGDKDAVALKAVAQKLFDALEKGSPARSVALTSGEEKLARTLHLLTKKPILYVLNKKTDGRNLDDIRDVHFEKLTQTIESNDAQWVIIDASTEQDLNTLSTQERTEFRESAGITGGIDALIQKSYALLGLITFFTTGETETRAWTIKEGATAPEAGAAIHTDFQNKFIRATVISWETLLETGSWAAAREKGLVRTEGKDYIVHDSDVMEFLHS